MTELNNKELYELKKEEKNKDKKVGDIKKASKRLFWWLFVTVIIIAAVWSMVKVVANNAPVGEKGIQKLSVEDMKILPGDWVKGDINSNIVLIEYSDLQCPACGAYYPFMKQLTTEFGDKIAFVYRHFPLKQLHKHAEAAARAAEAAGKQGKFWEMHDILFERQQMWSAKLTVKATFSEYAKELGLDVDKFEKDADSLEIRGKVENNFLSGERNKVNSTPSFFLNGTKLQNPRGYEEFKEVINNAIKEE